MTEAFRLTLELGEETRARWQAAAVRIGYERLDVWAYDTLDASADPEAGQVVGVETMGGPERVELRARLTTAEQEAERLEDALRFIVTYPNGVGDHAPYVVARAALGGSK